MAVRSRTTNSSIGGELKSANYFSSNKNMTSYPNLVGGIPIFGSLPRVVTNESRDCKYRRCFVISRESPCPANVPSLSEEEINRVNEELKYAMELDETSMKDEGSTAIARQKRE